MVTTRHPKFPDRYTYAGDMFSGGQGDVYICEDSFLCRKVAIKIVSAAENVPEFTEEVSALRDVSSAHIAEIYDLIMLDDLGLPGLVEEYVPGQDLSRLYEAGLSKEEYLKTLYQIACGILDMHVQGKIHRDIKPANIKFDGEGVVKILDFGISCDLSPDAETIHSRGTTGFRPPELYHPPVHVSPAVDVYAFGVTAWVMCIGGLPPALCEIPPQSKHAAPPFSDLGFDLPKDVSDILDKTLLIDPRMRPDMGTVRDVLKQYLLTGKYRAELVHQGKTYLLDKPGTQVRLGSDILGKVTIRYDGTKYNIKDVEGNVYINNQLAQGGMQLPGSSVITIGSPEHGSGRLFIPFNISHPEVVL